MGFSIISSSTGKQIPESVLLDEIDGYEEGDLEELSDLIDLSIEGLCTCDDSKAQVESYLCAAVESLGEIFNYINIIECGDSEEVFLGFGDKVVPGGVVITVDGEECNIGHPAQLYDDTLIDFVTSLELESAEHAAMLETLSIRCTELLAYAVVLSVVDASDESLVGIATAFINGRTEIDDGISYDYSTGVPYTIDPVE